MKGIIYLLFVTIFLLDYLSSGIPGAARYVGWMPEVLSAVATMLIVIRLVTRKTIFLHPKYMLLLTLLVVHVLAGIVLNAVQPGAIVTGLRTYLKYLPFFFVPAVYEFSEREVMTQLKVLLAVALLQFPLVIYQRFVQFAGVNSGDPIAGTMNRSSILSIFLVSAVALVLAFYLRKKLTLFAFCIILAGLFLPTTLNETKGTLILLPLALVIPIFVSSKGKGRLAGIGAALALGTMLLGSFVIIYNAQPGWSKEGVELNSFFAEEKYQTYLYKGTEGTKSGEALGKVDSYVLAIKTLSQDFTKLAFGLGVGNITDTFSERLSGEYARKYAHMEPNKTALAYMLWEIGLLGVLIVLGVGYLLLQDARHLSRMDSVSGTLALGWVAVVLIYITSLFYKNVLIHNVVVYPFWYLSGYIAAARFRWQWEKGWV